MPAQADTAALGLAPARAELAKRLAARRAEIEAAALSRVHAIAASTDSLDAEYQQGLRAAVAAAVGYGIETLGGGEQPVPAVLLAQARLAARNGVSLDAVLRRYFSGYALLGDFLVAEAQDEPLLQGIALKQLLREQASNFDRLIAAISDEHAAQIAAGQGTGERRRAELIQGLLDGELLDPSPLAYELEGSHLAVIAAGPCAADAIRELAQALDRRLLAVSRTEGVIWAWLGGAREVRANSLERHLATAWPDGVALATGEPAQGLAGWRLSHRQARAALPLALHGTPARVRYADVALLASMLQDDVLLRSLEQLYLRPLAKERDGGEALRTTLRAYFAAGRNVSSAASALGVHRHTVNSRLRTAEERIGSPLDSCAAQLEAALQLEDFMLPTRHVVDYPMRQLDTLEWREDVSGGETGS